MPEPSSDPPSNPAAGIRVTLAFAGRQRFHRDYWRPQLYQQWVLDVIVRGRQQQRIGGEDAYERTAGLPVLYAPGSRYYEREEEGLILDEAYVVFDAVGPVSERLHELTGDAGYCRVEDPHGLVAGPLQRLGARYRESGSAEDLMVNGLMLETLALLLSSTPMEPGLSRLSPDTDPAQILTARVSEYLEKHWDQPIRVGDLAAAVGMSPSAFAHAYPEAAGETPYQTILRSKTAAAKHLLLSEGLNVQETADRLGFSTPFTFSRAFKRVTGLSPAHFTARHRGQSE